MTDSKINISIIDYGAGTVKSIGNMLEYLGVSYKITPDKKEIKKADKIIFPGQGHFEQAMKKLKEFDMVNFIQDLTLEKEFLGICLGLQVLFEKSEEAPCIEGLKIFKGEVLKFKQGKTPQIGVVQQRGIQLRQSPGGGAVGLPPAFYITQGRYTPYKY